ncbi:MAG: YlbF family regulator [Clostridiaceae bacterium]
MGLYESSNNFINTIKSTREFIELIQTKNIIERNSSLRKDVNEFSNKLKEIYSSSSSANEIEVKVQDLNRQFGSLFKSPDVNRFLKASKLFNDMMFKVYKSISDSLETELKFK